MTSERKKTPRWVWTLVKLAIAAGVVGWMVREGAIRLDDLRQAGSQWRLLLAALAAVLVAIFLQSIRWGLLLQAQGIRIRLMDLYTLAMTGLFFTVIAPGGIGGDAVKAYYVARGREKKAEAATTVFLDRFLGLATLFLVAAVTVGFKCRTLWYTKVVGLDRLGLPGGRILVLVIAAGLAGMMLVALLVISKRVRQSKWLGALSRLVPFRQTAVKVYDALHLYGERPGAILGATAVSIVAQVPLYLVYYLYGVAVGAEIELWHCALIVPPAMVVRVLPLVPGGAGQGMVAMRLLFPLVGVAKGAAIGALGDAMFVVVYLIGGLFFIFGKTSYGEVRAAVEPGSAKRGAE